MGKIVLLDEETINKIAAGEVVDKPASIVKELVENSIDAGASHITVEIKNGGITSIKVIDDGSGISKDDVRIAFERHATSKIRRESDILKISSMGFRGEALASIASISKVVLDTKTQDDYTGTRIVVEGGIEQEFSEIQLNKGTKITIENVFYNVPARYKFLKKDSVEALYVEEVMTKISLSHPNISFKYISNGKQVFITNGNGDIRAVVLNIFGNTYATSLLDVDYEYLGLKLRGVIGLPTLGRGTRQNEYTFVNTRYIKNKTFSTAIEKGYEQNILIGKFPFVILNIEISPKDVDVNVHPAKLEVKFENENKIFELVYYGIQNTLKEHNRKISPFYSEEEQNKNEIRKEINKDLQVELGEDKNIEFEEKEEYINYSKKNVDTFEKEMNDNTNTLKENFDITYYTENKDISEIVDTQSIKKQEYKYIGQAFDTYIIIEIKDAIYIIDQHAAHERLIYESIKEMYYNTKKETQMLLVPTLIELTNSDKLIVIDNIDMFIKAGYIIEDFGSNEIKISGVPNVGYDMDFKEMFTDIIDVLKGTTSTVSGEKEKRFIYTLACKAAVKANMRLTKEEHIALIDKMMMLEKPFTCPHGRPTAISMTKYEIERKFSRK